MATVPSQDRRAAGQSRSSIIQSNAVIAKVRGQNLGDVGNRLAKKPVDRFQAVSDSQDDHDQDYTMFGRLSAQTLKQLKQRLRDACYPIIMAMKPGSRDPTMRFALAIIDCLAKEQTRVN